jgi:hypothetical protein
VLFDGTTTRWLAIAWHYLLILLAVAGGFWTLLELPSAIARRYRQLRNYLALRSQSSAAKRLKKLESELVKLGQEPVIEQYQVKFYVWILGTFSASTIGLAAWALSIYIVPNDHPSPLMALAVIMLPLSSIISLTGMNHFQKLVQAVRDMRRRELEAGITAMRNKLAKFGETQH